jgi:hypothetical protein
MDFEGLEQARLTSLLETLKCYTDYPSAHGPRHKAPKHRVTDAFLTLCW